jgi:cyclophilin family peptidyl-prolyl cis-trans isomerase
MIRRTAVLASVVISMCGMAAEAAVLAPVKGYAKPGEPVAIKFLNENEQGKKALEKIGLAAVELEGMFTPAAREEIIDAGGNPLFTLYTFDGKKVPMAEVKPAVEWQAGSSSLDLSKWYPEVEKAGTYVLVWKDATPLVIETLRNPLPWSVIMDENRVPVPMRPDAIKQTGGGPAVVTHIVPLQYVEIKTERGNITAKFAYDVAPHTVDNFISLATQKFYDGAVFHRAVPGFMIQGGDSMGSTDKAGMGGPGYGIVAEFNEKKHERGTLSMARRQLPIDSAGSQFFIVHQREGSAKALDGSYTAFGDVIEGIKVVDDIVSSRTDKKTEMILGVKPKMESVRVLPATAEMYGIGKAAATSPATAPAAK